MRARGVLDGVTGLGAHDHVCFSYDLPEDFRARAIEFLGDGLRQGLQVRYVGSGGEESLWADISELLDIDAALRHGAIGVASLASMYDAERIMRPEKQVRTWADATEGALASGFEGLRVAVDATDLVRTVEQVDAFTRYEHLLDTYMTIQPLSTLCAYARGELGNDTVAALACMHPICNRGATPFRIFADTDADLAMGGELDSAVHPQFSLALERAEVRTARPEVVFDGKNLEFLDHRALLSLRQCARQSGATAVLRTNSRIPNRLMQMFAMEGIRAERSA